MRPQSTPQRIFGALEGPMNLDVAELENGSRVRLIYLVGSRTRTYDPLIKSPTLISTGK